MFEKVSIRTKFSITFLVLAVVTAITGGFGIFFSTNVGNHGKEVGLELAPLGDAAMEIKLTATTAHLWFEELINGDETQNMDEIFELLDETIWYCDAIIQGGSNAEGTFVASKDPEVLGKIREVKSSLIKFKESSQQRYQTKLGSAGIGSGIDQEFDNLYDDLQDELNNIVSDAQRSNNTQRLYLASNAKYLLANGHLFLEELLSGDKSVKFVEIQDNFNTAQNNIKQLTSGQLLSKVENFNNIVNQRNEDNIEATESGKKADENFDTEYHKFITLADEAEELVHHSMDMGMNNLIKQQNRSKSVMIIISILAVLIAVFFAYLLTQDIIKQLGCEIYEATEIADNFANGNLVYKFREGTAVGLYLNLKQTTSRLRDILHGIKEGTNNIANASQQTSVTSQQLSQGATEQASSVEEVSSTMEEMAANIQQNTDNANQTEKIATMAKVGIESVSEQSKQNVEANKQIAEKISIVSDIAFQTNILALNAAVEAACAGEHGKGFAVVAAEVRKLAERSKVAAEEIVTLAQNSLTSAEETGKKMEELLPEVVKTAQLVQEIASASVEQNNGATQVNNALQQLNNVTQQNAAASEELATSAEEMSAQTDQLKQMVEFFKIDEHTYTSTSAMLINQDNEKIKKTEEKKAIKEFRNETFDESDFHSF